MFDEIPVRFKDWSVKYKINSWASVPENSADLEPILLSPLFLASDPDTLKVISELFINTFEFAPDDLMNPAINRCGLPAIEPFPL